MDFEVERACLDASGLSEREMMIAEAAAQGVSDDEIARELGVNLGTLNRHWARLCQKIGVGSREEAINRHLKARVDRVERANIQLSREAEDLRREFQKISDDAKVRRSVLDHIGEGVATTDRAGRVTYCNDRFPHLLEVGDDEVIGNSLYSLVGPEEGQVLQKKVEEHRATTPLECDIETTSRDGRRRQLRLSAVVWRDDAGEWSGMVVAMSDVTHKKRLQAALQQALGKSVERTNQFEQYLEALPIGVAFYSGAGQVIQANARIVSLWGPKATRLPTKADIEEMDCRWTADGRRLSEALWVTRRVLAGREEQAGMDVTVRLPDGARRRLLCSAAVLRDAAGAVSGVAVAVVDLTGLKPAASPQIDRSGVGVEIARAVEVVEALAQEEALQPPQRPRARTGKRRGEG